MLTKKHIADKVWAIYGDTQEEVGKAFVRFQEYYENKDLRGTKDITIRMVEDWWAEECKDQETCEPYYTYWTGFNIPGKVILTLMTTSEFRAGFNLWAYLIGPRDYPRWHPQEDQLIDLLQDLDVNQINTGYFIGLSKTSTEVLDHELAHALYATNLSYLRDQMYNLSQLPKDIYDKFREDLISCGYHPNVVRDEMQAYLSTYVSTLQNSFDTTDYDIHTPIFEKTFKNYSEVLTSDSFVR